MRAQFRNVPVKTLWSVIGSLPAAGLLAFGVDEPGWISLFNGKDLTGWTPRNEGTRWVENPGNTFRVENGAICVRYDGMEKFENHFGHLFYREPFTNYVIRGGIPV